MKDHEAASVSVNHCVRDRELAELDDLARAADPGEWRVRNGEVQRYSGAPFGRPEASRALMARAVTAIPRLLRGIRVLEEALRSAWVSASIARRELAEERERHVADIERASQACTGPDSDIDALVEAIELGVFTMRASSIGTERTRANYLARWIRAWASGVSAQAHPQMRIDLEHARRRHAEDAKFRAEMAAQDAHARAEVLALLDELKLKKRERDAVIAKARERIAGDGG